MDVLNNFIATATIQDMKDFLAHIEEHRNTGAHRVVERAERIIHEYEKLIGGANEK